MLEPDRWEDVLSKVTGVIFRGVERVSSAHLLDLLQVGLDHDLRARMGKRIVSHMRRLGWVGPRSMRIPGDKNHCPGAGGYWRKPSRPPQPDTGVGDDVAAGLSDDLPFALEQTTRLALQKLARVLRVPLDITDGNLVRSQVTAALGIVNAQLRADEARLRTKTASDVLERLEKLIAEQKKLIPKQHLAVSPPTVQPDVELASSNAEAVPPEASGEG